MFNKGDKIVYPMYGAGVVEALEDNMIDGKIASYYVMRLPLGNLTIKVSVSKACDLGIREIHSPEVVLDIISKVGQSAADMSENWNQRYKENLVKLKTGDLLEVGLVYKNLMQREKEKGLSSAEKKVLTTAKQIVVSELILSQEIDKIIAEEILEKSIEF